MKRSVVGGNFLMFIFNDPRATLAFNIEYLALIKDGILIRYLNPGAFLVVRLTSKGIISAHFLIYQLVFPCFYTCSIACTRVVPTDGNTYIPIPIFL